MKLTHSEVKALSPLKASGANERISLLLKSLTLIGKGGVTFSFKEFCIVFPRESDSQDYVDLPKFVISVWLNPFLCQPMTRYNKVFLL